MLDNNRWFDIIVFLNATTSGTQNTWFGIIICLYVK